MSGHDDTGKDLVGRSQALSRRSATGLVARGLRDVIAKAEGVVVRGRLMWARSLSPDSLLSLEDARRYVHELRLDGYSDWRLPTHDELQGLVDPSELSKDAHDRRPFPLVKPFDIPLDRRVHSDTEIVRVYDREYAVRLFKVDLPQVRERGHYVMRTFNGHIFNGVGEAAYVRAVRDVLV